MSPGTVSTSGQNRPHPGVERTKSGAKRALLLEGRLSGAEPS